MRRPATRVKTQMPCDLVVGGSHHGGTVLDLSATGLFVQTPASPEVGATLTLEMSLPRHGAACVVRARVARLGVASEEPGQTGGAGVGIEIEQAPESYYGLLAGLMLEGRTDRALRQEGFAGPPPEVIPTALRRYRVRVARCDGPRTRILLLSAPSEGEACRHAIAEVGDGWKIDFCERA